MIHGFDIFALGFTALFVFVGVRRGLIGEVFRLLAMVGGVAAAILFYRPIYEHLAWLKAIHSAKMLVSFLAVYIVVFVALLLVGWVLRKLIRLTPLGWIDRLGGGGIGVLKAAIIIWLFLISLSALPDSAFKRGFSTSHAYRLSHKVPFPLNMARIESTRKSMEKAIETKAIKPAEQIRKKVEAVKAAVDSAKGKE